MLGKNGAEIPPAWPRPLQTIFNIDNQMSVPLSGAQVNTYLSVSWTPNTDLLNMASSRTRTHWHLVSPRNAYSTFDRALRSLTLRVLFATLSCVISEHTDRIPFLQGLHLWWVLWKLKYITCPELKLDSWDAKRPVNSWLNELILHIQNGITVLMLTTSDPKYNKHLNSVQLYPVTTYL